MKVHKKRLLLFAAAATAGGVLIVGGGSMAGAAMNTHGSSPASSSSEHGKSGNSRSTSAGAHTLAGGWTCKKKPAYTYCQKWQRYDRCGSSREPQVIIQNTGRVNVRQALLGSDARLVGSYNNGGKFKQRTVGLHPWSSYVRVEYLGKKWKKPVFACTGHP